VVIGVGQVLYRDTDAPEPVALLAEAARRAIEDCGTPGARHAISSVRVVNMISRRYPDPGRLVAEHLGATVPHTVSTSSGGQMPQVLIDGAARDVARGDADVVLIGGAESWRTRNARRRRGESSPWTVQDPGIEPSDVVGGPLLMTSPEEESLGFTDPVQAYPIFEQALRRHTGRSLEEQVDAAAALWSRFSEVAVANPFAALRRRHAPSEIRTVGADNRMIGSPYPKLMNANSNVDQGAAVLVCSAGRASELGVARDRWVFLHGAAEGDDTAFVSQRPDLARSPAIERAGTTALGVAGVGVDDLAHVDLYSCFPSAVQVSAAALGLSLDRPLTVTGGLTFAGGPWNNYVSHAVATMVGILREEPESYGLCSANGGLLTKHAVAVYSCRPVRGGSDPRARVRSVREELAAHVRPRRPAPDFCGTAPVESWTVMHDRSGAPQRAYAFALLDDGRRTLAATEDPGLVALLAERDVLDAPATFRAGALMEVGA
jgi:acetyl-CoA C-acetyltransferase